MLRFAVVTALLSLFLLKPTFLKSQSTTTGTEFWLGYMENLDLLFNDAPVFTISVATDQPANGTVTVPVTGLTLPFSVPAGVTEIELFNAILYSAGSNNIDNKGLLIETDVPVQLYANHYRSFFSEATIVLPVEELGEEYLVTTPMNDPQNSNQPNSFVVVATQDNTEIEIVPTALTLNLFPANVPINITLQRGENYQVQAFGDLSGSTVISTSAQPVAVFSGAREANINAVCLGFANSHVWDQCLPTTHFRDLYYFVPFNGQQGDGIKILAVQDNTEVFFDCELEVTLDAGQSYATPRTVPTVISATGPVSLTHYNDEGSCNPGDLGDPNGLTYLPADFRGTEFSWFATDRLKEGPSGPPYFTQHGLTVIVPQSAINNVTLDGVTLTGFSAFPGDPSRFYLTQTVTGGSHELLCSDPIQAYAYGFNEFDAYTMNLGYTINEEVEYDCGCDPNSGSIQITPLEIGCPGEESSFELSFDYPMVGAWYWVFEGDTIFDETFIETYVYDDPGTYTIEVAVLTTDDCIFIEQITVTIPDCTDPCQANTPTFNEFAFGSACVDSVYTFGITIEDNLSPVTSVVWTSTFNGQMLVGDTLSITIPQAGSYGFDVVITLDDGCSYSLPYSIVIDECTTDCAQSIPTLTPFGNAGCVDSIINFGLTVSGNTSPIAEIRWEAIDEEAGSIFLSEDDTVAVTYALPGTYDWNYNLILENGCVYAYEGLFPVTIEECEDPNSCSSGSPDVTIRPANERICVDSIITLDLILNDVNGGVIDSVIWRNALTGDSFTSRASNDLQWTELVLNEPILYLISAQIFKNNGCVYERSTTVTARPCEPIDTSGNEPPDTMIIANCKVYWPNAFSPNFDGVNDGFQPFFAPECPVVDYELIIYDRWGGGLFQTTDQQQGWDGTTRGREMNAGVYLYVARYSLSDGQSFLDSGELILVR